MNVKELQEKKDRFRSAAELKLEEADKAIEAGDMELTKSLQAEAADLVSNANVISAQIAAVKSTADLKDEPAPATSETKTVDMPPFEDADNDADADDDPVDVTKAIYSLRFTDEDSATKAVIEDLYGANYYENRTAQMQAFSKFVRWGDRDLSSNEMKLLKTVILLPETVRNDIKAGLSVGNIKATLQEMLQDLGGYLVPEDFRASLVSRLMGLTIVRSRARIVSTTRDAIEWPRLEGGNSQYTSGVRVTWVDEIPSSATVADTNPTFGMTRIPVHTVMARTDISRNLIEDSAFNVLELMRDLFAEAMAIDEDIQFITGRGSGTPRGILAKGTIIEPAPDTGIAVVNTGDAAALTADGLYNLVYGLQTQYRGNAAFIGERLTHRDVRKLQDGNSRYLWEDSLKAGEPPTLLGYPFEETESMPTVAAEAHPLVFGDPRGYVIADRVGMEVRRVEDSTTVGKNYVALFARRRLGGAVVEPWRFQVQKVSV